MQIAQYTVSGVDRNTSADIQWTIEAASEQNARAKAELRGAVVTSIRRLDKTAMPAERPSGEGASGGTAKDEMARRWPWKRIARWSYNWYLLLSIWIVFGALRALGTWSIAPGSAIVDGLFVCLLLCILSEFKQRIDDAARALHWVLGAACILDIVVVCVMKMMSSPQAAIEAAIVAVVVAAFVRLGILLPLLRPLVKPRFGEFSMLLTDLEQNGVPVQNFIKRPATRSRVAGREPGVRMSWPKLVRAIAVGKVVVPEDLLDGASRPPAHPATVLARHSQGAERGKADTPQELIEAPPIPPLDIPGTQNDPCATGIALPDCKDANDAPLTAAPMRAPIGTNFSHLTISPPLPIAAGHRYRKSTLIQMLGLAGALILITASVVLLVAQRPTTVLANGDRTAFGTAHPAEKKQNVSRRLPEARALLDSRGLNDERGRSPREAAMQEVEQEAISVGAPTGMFGTKWLMSRDEVERIAPRAQRVGEKLVVHMSVQGRDASVEYHFKDDLLLMVLITFSGFSNETQWDTVQHNLEKNYGPMPAPVPAAPFRLKSSLQKGRFRVEHLMTLSGGPIEQVLVFRTQAIPNPFGDRPADKDRFGANTVNEQVHR